MLAGDALSIAVVAGVVLLGQGKVLSVMHEGDGEE
jgi:hypothetical protein